MPSTRLMLAALPRAELRRLLAQFDLEATDARKVASLCTALQRGLPAEQSLWLGKLPAAVLKQLAAELAVEVKGAGKAALIDALAAKSSRSAPTAAKAAAGRTRTKKAASQARAAHSGKKPGKTPTSAQKAKQTSTKTRAQADAPAAKSARAQSVSPTAKQAKPIQPARSAAPKARKEARAATPGSAANEQPHPAQQAASDATKTTGQAELGSPAEQPTKAAAKPRHMLSWTEAVALATKRGQSAASMIGQPAESELLAQLACEHCSQVLSLQPCQIQACDHRFIAQSGRKICAECMFERNNMSVDAFHDRLREDWTCLHCQEKVAKPV